MWIHREHWVKHDHQRPGCSISANEAPLQLRRTPSQITNAAAAKIPRTLGSSGGPRWRSIAACDRIGGRAAIANTRKQLRSTTVEARESAVARGGSRKAAATKRIRNSRIRANRGIEREPGGRRRIENSLDRRFTFRSIALRGNRRASALRRFFVLENGFALRQPGQRQAGTPSRRSTAC